MTPPFILDFGSGNTCKNDKDTIKKMIEELFSVISECDVDPSTIGVKWQLFKEAGQNVPLTQDSFRYAHEYAKGLGFKSTASVFDQESLEFLLSVDDKVPFVKIANRQDLWQLIPSVPRDTELVISVSRAKDIDELSDIYGDVRSIRYLCCVSEYPARAKTYRQVFTPIDLMRGISDHTQTWALFRGFLPDFYECHFKLEDSTGLDSGPFSRTPKQVKELFNVCKQD